MRAADLAGARVAIWGLGREGQAAIQFLRAHDPQLPLLLLDDSASAHPPEKFDNFECAFGKARIARALDRIDLLVKSPGVSLYRPEIETARRNGVKLTSLLNLWFAEKSALTTICVTGTKGKSTTASLIAQILSRLGRRVALAGNIGVPVTEIDQSKTDFAVIEVSSYQAADFNGICDIAVLTSLFPEHLDWHRTLDAYYRDKLNLLRHSRCAIVNRQAALASGLARRFFNDSASLHACGIEVFDGPRRIGEVGNRYLVRPHNLSNVCAALTVAQMLGLDLREALDATRDFRALPHRQQEIGEIDGVLYVDDSISTAPESTLAALEVYAGREITLLVGGHDRGIDYSGLVAKLAVGAVRTVLCLGASGERIYAGLRASKADSGTALAPSMAAAVAMARRVTPKGGVVLLSPAAPSYGAYRDFAERGCDFAAKAGFGVNAGDQP
jgi:UDP-N-acetylmuramoyl-L-alanine---L-glutamate ligase